MRNIYKNEMINLIKSSKDQIVSGAQLVNCYKKVAAHHDRPISQNHIPLNVHKFAKRYGQKVDVVKTSNGRSSTLYSFSF